MFVTHTARGLPRELCVTRPHHSVRHVNATGIMITHTMPCVADFRACIHLARMHHLQVDTQFFLRGYTGDREAPPPTKMHLTSLLEFLAHEKVPLPNGKHVLAEGAMVRMRSTLLCASSMHARLPSI